MTERRIVTVDGSPYHVTISDEEEALLAAYAAGGAVIGIWDRRRPVSYTHLDVYKRQGYAFIVDGRGSWIIESSGSKTDDVYAFLEENGNNSKIQEELKELMQNNKACLLYTSISLKMERQRWYTQVRHTMPTVLSR